NTITCGESQIKTKTIPGMLVVRLAASAGRVESSVDLIDGRQLDFQGLSIKGRVSARISDKFLGQLSVASLFGNAEVKEAEGTQSVITYEKDTEHAKSGRKAIDNAENVEGKLELSGAISGASLEFF
ncbi:hypothetical protein BGZ65_012507, partial [Modicella reniformis]